MKIRLLLLPALLAAALSASLFAQVTLPAILSSHMVVQRDLPVHVWGMAAPAETVTVAFRGHTATVTAGPLGRWSLYLAPGAAGGPFQMTVKGSAAAAGADPQPITLDDILVGDVWVASGQSNMEFLLKNAAGADKDLLAASIPNLRLLVVKKNAIEYPQDDVKTDGWAASTPDTAKDFSAVAWYFAREIGQREHVPVGVIDSTWGGTPVEAWTRMEAIGQDAALMPLMASWGRMTEGQTDVMLRDKAWQQKLADAKAQGKPAPEMPWVPKLDSWGPAMLYNGMIAPLTPMAIKGALWYQGESNTAPDRASLYGRAFQDMITDWRRQWGVGEFPFLFVQLANFKNSAEWPTLRDQQLKTLALKNTGMAVTIDIGNPDNVHPTDKLNVGLRLARWARARSYGEQIEVSGPLFRQATPEGAQIRAYFDHAKGLAAKGGAPTGFEVAGADLKFAPASAVIEGDTVVVKSDQVAEPHYVRYGWANNPACNLFNGESLPASPFSSAVK